MNDAQRKVFVDEMLAGTPRALRAHRFANFLFQALRDFLPQERMCARYISDHLTKIGFENNFEIINVPDRCDALDKLSLERHMIEAKTPGIDTDADDWRFDIHLAIGRDLTRLGKLLGVSRDGHDRVKPDAEVRAELVALEDRRRA